MDGQFEVCVTYKSDKDNFKKVVVTMKLMVFLNEVSNASKRWIWVESLQGKISGMILLIFLLDNTSVYEMVEYRGIEVWD